MSEEIKHDGCFYCGSRSQAILESIRKKIKHTSGREDTQAVAVCSTCAQIPILDMRDAPVNK